METGLSASDVLALTNRDGDGFIGGGVGWIILLFIFILAVFGGNGGWLGNGNGGNALTQAELQTGLYQQTTDRNLSDIRSAQCQDTMTLNNAITTGNYNALLTAKDMQAQMAQCCCETQKTIIEQNQLTRDAINELKIGELADKLSLARAQISNFEQSQYLLGALGNYYTRPSVNPYSCYNTTCGCNY